MAPGLMVRPSSTQFDRRDSLQLELKDALASGEALLGPELTAINERLTEAGLEPLTSLDRDSWNEKEGMASFSAAVGKHFRRVELPAMLGAFSLQ